MRDNRQRVRGRKIGNISVLVHVMNEFCTKQNCRTHRFNWSRYITDFVNHIVDNKWGHEEL